MSGKARPGRSRRCFPEPPFGGGFDIVSAAALAGDLALVGDLADDSMALDAGAVRVFEFAAGQWTQTTTLFASDAQASDLFGEALSLDGPRLLVGASGENSLGKQAGAAYLFGAAERRLG